MVSVAPVSMERLRTAHNAALPLGLDRCQLRQVRHPCIAVRHNVHMRVLWVGRSTCHGTVHNPIC